MVDNASILFPHQTTDIYQAAFALTKRVHEAHIKHAELKDQAERASISCLLAIGEGLPHDSPRMRAQYFTRSKASLCEVVTATHAAEARGAMSSDDWHACQLLAVRVRAMLIALLR